jgi:exopolysaccharide biosynthesis polyprenyl glycosylphosphotransferase
LQQLIPHAPSVPVCQETLNRFSSLLRLLKERVRNSEDKGWEENQVNTAIKKGRNKSVARYVDDLEAVEPLEELSQLLPSGPAPRHGDRIGPVPSDEIQPPTPRGFFSRNAKQVLVASDVFAIFLGFAFAWLFGGQSSLSNAHLWISAAGLVVGPLILASRRLYKSRFIIRHTDELRFILHSTFTGAILIALLGFIANVEIHRPWFWLVLVGTSAALVLEREIARVLFGKARRSGRQHRPVIIVGYNGEADRISATLTSEPEHGYEVVGFIDSRPSPNGHSVFERTMNAIGATGATGVIIATTAVDMASANRLVRSLSDQQIHVELSSSLVDIAPERLFVRPVGRFPTLYVEPAPRHGWRAMAKRTFDIVVSSALLIATLPVTIAAALGVKFTSDGPLFFAQTRVGRGGETFPVYKFRTMVVDAEERLAELQAQNEADGPLFKLANDPRITKVGGVLRKFSIDELPQLWNVIKGDMSLVGPRPALPSEMMEWEPEHHDRLHVRPGITGMWQVSGRSDTTFEDYIRLDLYYVHNWSLVTDMAIVAKTIPAVLFAKGAR